VKHSPAVLKALEHFKKGYFTAWQLAMRLKALNVPNWQNLAHHHKLLGQSTYTASIRARGEHRGPPMGCLPTRSAKFMREQVLATLPFYKGDQLVTVWAHHDNGFSDQYEFIAKVHGKLYRSFYNTLTTKAAKGVKAAEEIYKFIGDLDDLKQRRSEWAERQAEYEQLRKVAGL
jgi:hypothetical protein